MTEETFVPKTRKYEVVNPFGSLKVGEILNLPWNNDTWGLMNRKIIVEIPEQIKTTAERIHIANKGSIKDLKLFFSACKTIRQEPTFQIEKDRIKAECGSGDFKFYGDFGKSNFEVFEINEPFICQFNTKDITELIDKDTDKLEMSPLRDKNAIGVRYFKNGTMTLESELGCRG